MGLVILFYTSASFHSYELKILFGLVVGIAKFTRQTTTNVKLENAKFEQHYQSLLIDNLT